MSELKRMPWQLHVFADETKPGTYKIITNNFKLLQLDLEEFPYAVSPFIGCPGKLEIKVYDCVGTEDERKAVFDYLNQLFDKQRRAVGFLKPVHSALHTYWYNVSSQREKYDVRGLKNVLNGKPVLYCGAGPSLETHFDTIRDLVERDSVFVITGGTGIKLLHDAGIVPHLCLAVDPFDQEIERFEGLTEEWQKQTTLLASASLNPTCYESWKGKLVAAEGINCMPTGEFVEGEDIVQLHEGPVGVTTWMLELVEYLGSDTIHLVGVDLCFGPKNQTYANDVSMTANEYVYIPDYQGKATRSNWIFEANHIAEVAEQKGYKIWNSSNGLEIPNTGKMDLSTVANLYKNPQKVDLKLKKWTKKKYADIKRNLKKLRGELLFTANNMGEETIQDQIGYKHLLKPYDDIQEYQYWRTGMYNYSLMREVLYKNAELINKVLQNVQYDGEYPLGHLGSPSCPAEPSKKIKTGSNHVAEVKNATTSNGSNTGKNSQ